MISAQGTGTTAAPVEIPAELLPVGGPVDRERLREFTVKSLAAAASSLGLAKSGTKDAVITRIAQHLENPPQEG